MVHIFISYSKKDSRQLAEKLFQNISRMENFTVWMDKSLEAAESWAWQIQDEIEKADLVLVLLSPDVNRRPTEVQRRSFVLNEIDFAQQLHKSILPIMAEQTIAPVQIAGLEYIDLSRDMEHGLERLYNKLAKLQPTSSNPVLENPISNIKTEEQPSSRPPIESPKLIVEKMPEAKSLVLPDIPKKKIDNKKLVSNSQPKVLIMIGTLLGVLAVAIGAYIIWSSNFRVAPAIVIDYPLEIETAIEAAENFSGTRNNDWEVVTYEFPDGVEMALVPAGCFQMGNDSSAYPNYAQGEILDGGRQCFSAFWVDRTEVAQEDFDRLGGEKSKPDTNNRNTFPVDSITWFEAVRYCEQQGKRLPTEAEWEYVARGVEALIFPWSNEWNEDNLNFESNRPLAVDSMPAGVSWVGALNLLGNVEEWTSSGSRTYPYTVEDETGDATQRIVRGGSWQGYGWPPHSATRKGVSPSTTSEAMGFRCVREIN